MSHQKLRMEKNCLNCEHTVTHRYCENCGQENVESRQSARHLIIHFFEDLTHYDGGLWKTMRYLFFNPGKLTIEYLAGKRKTYVPPVKLYIFISFITFFIPSILPNPSAHTDTNIEESDFNAQLNETEYLNVNSEKELDSLQKIMAEQGEAFMIPFVKKSYELKRKGYTGSMIFEKYIDSVVHMLPKALFLYLPLFALVLWAFHNKKKYWYFDHGIFTLHYFSFLLLFYFLFFCVKSLLDHLHLGYLSELSYYIFGSGIIWVMVYYLIAHRKCYLEINRRGLRIGVILIINSILFVFLMLIMLYISYFTIH